MNRAGRGTIRDGTCRGQVFRCPGPEHLNWPTLAGRGWKAYTAPRQT